MCLIIIIWLVKGVVKMNRRMCITGLVLLVSVVSCMVSTLSTANGADKKKLLRVGVYDSRGIAIAYGNSEYMSNILRDKQAALEQAKKDGDMEKVKEIEAWGPEHQAKMHLQGFGTAPVHEYLDCVKDKLPKVAEAMGVDVVVSKWELDYLGSDAETVDVTMELAKLFEPKEKAYQWIQQLKDKAPISTEQLKHLESEGSH